MKISNVLYYYPAVKVCNRLLGYLCIIENISFTLYILYRGTLDVFDTIGGLMIHFQ